jgi:hypothetical protein
MRYNTLNAVEHLIHRMQAEGIVQHFYYDADIMYFSLKSGERIMCYLIERAFTFQNLEQHLTSNTQKGRYSLFIFDADMFLPGTDDWYEMNDWMEGLEAIQGKIYGYEVAGRHSFFFPVYFEGVGRTRYVRHGELIDVALLHGETVTREGEPLIGKWRVASFDPQDAEERAKIHQPMANFSPLTPYYRVLGLSVGVNRELVKKTYRDLARQYHPDVNPSPQAMSKMQQINDAYRRIIQELSD